MYVTFLQLILTLSPYVFPYDLSPSEFLAKLLIKLRLRL